ncbi:MAG TPA: hypothetical protein VNO82_02560 [Solirubrobacteraceae bacterium]|nr:hypothetical protein [Solirubrobacteraceae bacterium]
MSARDDGPRDGERIDLWIAGPDDDVVYEIDEEAVMRLRDRLAAPRRARPPRRGAERERRERAAALRGLV